MVFVINYVFGEINDMSCVVQAIYDNEERAFFEAEKLCITEFLDNEYDPDSDNDHPREWKWFPCKKVAHHYHWKYCDICKCASKSCKCEDRWQKIPQPASHIDYNGKGKHKKSRCFKKTIQTIRFEWNFGKCEVINADNNNFHKRDYDGMINQMFVDECSVNYD